MSLSFSIALYFVIWWTVLFAVLPLWVRTQEEAGEVVPGTPESAPAKQNLLRTFAVTSVVAGVVFAIVYSIVVWNVVDLGAMLPDPTAPQHRQK